MWDTRTIFHELGNLPVVREIKDKLRILQIDSAMIGNPIATDWLAMPSVSNAAVALSSPRAFWKETAGSFQ